MEEGKKKQSFSYGEIKEMSTLVSPEGGKEYGIQRVCRVLEVSRASFYRRQKRKAEKGKKRGPKTELEDKELKEENRFDIEKSR